MSQFKLTAVLERPITPDLWPVLESIGKGLNQYINQCIKNREYIEAQKAKQKIIEVQDQLRKRNRNDIEMRQIKATQELQRHHQEERIKLEKEMNVVCKKIENQFGELISRKIERQQFQREKHLQQIEIALPLNNSPDKILYKLRHQQEEYAKIGDFIEAQRVKMEIAKREQEISKKNQNLRQSNIKIMMGELQYKQRSQLLMLQSRRDLKQAESEKFYSKKIKQQIQKQQRQIKELHWIYGEQKKKIK